MAVRIRLSRGGAKKRAYYRIVVANSTAPRDGKFIEKVGVYNPLLNDNDVNRVVLKQDRVQYWLNQGAKASDRVVKFIESSGLKLSLPQQKTIATKAKTRQAKPKKKTVSS